MHRILALREYRDVKRAVARKEEVPACPAIDLLTSVMRVRMEDGDL